MKKYIAISGKISSGKTSVSKHLIKKHDYKMYALATPLKEIASWYREYSELTSDSTPNINLIVEKIYELRKKLIDLCGNEVIAMSAELQLTRGVFSRFRKVDWSVEKNDQQRALLQQIGQCLRETISPTIWIDYLINKIKKENPKLVVIDDIRYRNEADAFKDAGFAMVRLDVTKETQDKRIKKLYGDVEDSKINHISETDLDNYDFDFHVDADIKLADMLKVVDNIVEEKNEVKK